MFTIQNIISTASLYSKSVDLWKISKLEYVKYDPKHLNAAIIRIQNPKATGLLFSSGKVVCVGTKTAKDNREAVEKFSELLKTFNYSSKVTHYTIHNYVGSFNIGSPINVTQLAKTHKFVQYEPELFPGAVIRFSKSKPTALVFFSGKVILTGLKSEAEMRRFYKQIISVLDLFKRNR